MWFLQAMQFPNILGIIDYMHVRIVAPSDDEPSYVNQKGITAFMCRLFNEYESILICILPFRHC